MLSTAKPQQQQQLGREKNNTNHAHKQDGCGKAPRIITEKKTPNRHVQHVQHASTEREGNTKTTQPPVLLLRLRRQKRPPTRDDQKYTCPIKCRRWASYKSTNFFGTAREATDTVPLVYSTSIISTNGTPTRAR